MSPFHIYLYGPETGPLETSFEASATRLGQLDRLFFEPDGSFVWTDGQGQQLDGMLYDAAGRLQYVELQGQCSHENWQRIVQAIVGEQVESLSVMKLPNRQLQNLQPFEESVWLIDSID